MANVIRSPQAKDDIKRILQYTIENWGEVQGWEYSALIEEALEIVGLDPKCGRPVNSGRQGILRYHLKQAGRNARHIVFYRMGVDGTVEIIRLLHDAMDFNRHLPHER